MSKELIRLTNLTMTFEDGETILDNINLYINNKEFLTLLGPSGCGKTTLLNMIGGLDTPSCGEVYVTGKCITAMKERELSRFSAIPNGLQTPK